MAQSPFQLVVNLQWAAAFEDTEYAVHKDTTDLAQERSMLLASSLPCEHGFRAVKNNGQIKGSRKFRRPERSMGVAIGNKILDKQNRFTALPNTEAIGNK